ncbi:MAG: cytochrome C oxidase subunit IV family protein [Candidatus Krumholzibacteriia bacterium]|nr:cytochrome C oxidase subunit IV family protein [bacterium]MCB9514329.1 cytochrome C oxidase subunit IV family protein [Candidatus Latescibacterota bacterium]MCB9516765.1 cytochrome C oxidase subunit IV family protein [Candidatus Latescibacterota bacterium]
MTHGDHAHDAPHVVPLKVLLGVWAALLFFTFVTVAVTWINLGPLSLPVAIGIATVKAMLVALFFMHLKYDRPFNAVVLVSSIFFVLLFVGLALLDTLHYRDDLIPGYSPAMPKTEAAADVAATATAAETAPAEAPASH